MISARGHPCAAGDRPARKTGGEIHLITIQKAVEESPHLMEKGTNDVSQCPDFNPHNYETWCEHLVVPRKSARITEFWEE